MISYEDIEAFMEEVKTYRSSPQKVSEMVEEFASVMGQPKDPEMSALLVYEEDGEWYCENQRYSNRSDDYDPAKELKELADKVYVEYGYARSRGWDLEEALRRVHKNNMERCIWPDGSVKRRKDGKILKRPDAPKIDLSDLV